MGIKEIRETTESCKHCFMCRHACPTFLATKLDSHTPRGYALLLSEIDHGYQTFTKTIVDRFYQCSQCGLCCEVCAFHWAEDEVVRNAREEIVLQGKTPDKARNIAEAVINNDSPYGAEQKGWNIKYPKLEKAEILYFAGCSTRQNNPEIIKAVGRIIDHLNISWTMLEKEGCCGIPLYELGYTKEAQKVAAKTADQILARQPKTLITGCAHCLRAFKEFYAKWGITLNEKIQIQHTSQYIYGLICSGSLILEGTEKSTTFSYHDPCQLGRKIREFDAPRHLIEAATGLEPIEVFHGKQEAECCGAGATMFLMDPDIAHKVAVQRMLAVTETGCSVLVTACQNCKTMLSRVNRDIPNCPEVLDISELVANKIQRRNV
jgi:heterodisulfide reductase subunit D